jgi:hypothetical protein
VFKAAENGIALTFFEAWGGATAYTFQLYFDFSGYSDMAIGLARMFGIILPVNFYSPYKANSILEFWRRWHITLSRFLLDYLYIPLGGNRRGQVRRYMNLMITMLLGGLWHGAGWTFIIWGGMHGVFLSINHGWNAMGSKIFTCGYKTLFITKISGRVVTFIAVVIAWVMFRADSLDGAISMYSGMFGYNGISLPVLYESRLGGLGDILKTLGFTYQGMFHNGVFGDYKNGITLLLFMLLIVWFSPNIIDLFKNEKPVLGLGVLTSGKETMLTWKYNVIFAILLALLTVVCVLNMSAPSEFLYFQF